MTNFSALTMLLLVVFASFNAAATSYTPARAKTLWPALRAGEHDTAKAANDASRVSIRGRVADKQGPLPGAVVKLRGTNQATVTNAQGEFQLLVPATAGACRCQLRRLCRRAHHIVGQCRLRNNRSAAGAASGEGGAPQPGQGLSAHRPAAGAPLAAAGARCKGVM